MQECIHGMNPAWCAHCLKIKTPEEEQKESEKNWTIIIVEDTDNEA